MRRVEEVAARRPATDEGSRGVMTCAAYAGGRRVADVGVANIRVVLDRRDGRGRRRQTLTRPSDVSATRIELRKHSPRGQEPTNQSQRGNNYCNANRRRVRNCQRRRA